MSALADEIKAAVRAGIREELDSLRRAVSSQEHEEVLSLEKCARLSGYSIGTIRKAIRRGELQASKRAREWRVNREDLHAWRGRSVSAADAAARILQQINDKG